MVQRNIVAVRITVPTRGLRVHVRLAHRFAQIHPGIRLQNDENIRLPIRQRGGGELQLNHEPDPENEAFVYVRNAKSK